MKRILTVIACALMAATFTFAQDEARSEKAPSFGFGARAAFDYALMYGFSDDDENVDADPKGIGFEAGIMLRAQMIPNLNFAPEINFSYVSTSHQYLEKDRTYMSMDLEIPLLIRGTVAERFYVTAGPQLNLNLSSDYDYDSEAEYIEEKVEPTTFTFGLAAGAGFNIVEGLFVDLRYYMGLMDLYPDVKSAEDTDNATEVEMYSNISMKGAKMMKFKVGLSYWFL